MSNVLVAYKIPNDGIKLLKEAGHSVDVRESESLITRGELLQAVQKYDAIITLLTDKVDQEILASAGPQLKIIANYAVGYDNIDIAAAASRGIQVTNTPDVLNDAVAEHSMVLLSALARRIVEADTWMRSGKYRGWRPELFLGTGLKDKVLGIIGLGRIGQEVARRAHFGFGMRIAYNDLKPSPELEALAEAQFYGNIDELLPAVDAVSIHVPLLPSTQHLINEERLKLFKKTALLVNTARGPIIDEYALVQALRQHTIAGAALDVYEQEPEMASGLSELPNVIVTPHIGSATIEVREHMSRVAAQNIIAVLKGEQPLSPVEVPA